MFRKLVALMCFLGIGAISLSDRAPDVVRGLLSDARVLFHRIELRSGHDLLGRGDIPVAWDTAGHMVLWCIAGFVSWWAVGRRFGPLLLILALGSLSAGVEVAQVMLSATRLAELTDLAANMVGISVGVVAALTLDAISRALPSRANP